jgi:hypothetical protein
MPDNDILTQLLTRVVENQEKTTEALQKINERLNGINGLKIDPTKLTASTKDVVPRLAEVLPKDPSQPNLIEPVPRDAYGNIVARPCYKCGQMYQGIKHC